MVHIKKRKKTRFLQFVTVGISKLSKAPCYITYICSRVALSGEKSKLFSIPWTIFRKRKKSKAPLNKYVCNVCTRPAAIKLEFHFPYQSLFHWRTFKLNNYNSRFNSLMFSDQAFEQKRGYIYIVYTVNIVTFKFKLFRYLTSNFPISIIPGQPKPLSHAEARLHLQNCKMIPSVPRPCRFVRLCSGPNGQSAS